MPVMLNIHNINNLSSGFYFVCACLLLWAKVATNEMFVYSHVDCSGRALRSWDDTHQRLQGLYRVDVATERCTWLLLNVILHSPLLFCCCFL